MDLTSLRNEYIQAALDEHSVAENPVDQFRQWFEEAVSIEMLEPNAMVLGTAAPNPTQRTVLLKKFDDRGFVFFTNYTSRKARQIEENDHVSMLFPWYPLERQVAITGTATKITSKESLTYFVTRPFGSQMGAWISNQSKIISSRTVLETKFAEMKARFKDGKVPLPDFWGGYRIAPTSFEFWQGRPNRLHDRIYYEREQDGWKISRLAP